ncbi:MAG: hypothetical protein ABIW17_05840 [Marmoricola sp.]
MIAPLWLVVVLAALTANFAGTAGGGPSGAVEQRGDVSVFALEKGDCLISAIPEDVSTRTVEVGPCSGPHAAEVYAGFDLADGPYPGRDQVLRLAEGGCTKRFGESAGSTRDFSETDLSYLYPAPESWPTEKGVLCIVGTASADAPSTA